LPKLDKGPDKLATILSGEAKKLLAMDRYEQRALARRKFAIRAFDANELEPRPRRANVTRIGESLQSSAWLTKGCANGANGRASKFATWAASQSEAEGRVDCKN
jgi:hypothetical protein